MRSDEFVLVVGGAGYIGSHTNFALFRNGFNTVVFDNLDNGHERLAKWGKLIIGDLASTADIEAVFDRYRITAVVHFAAHAYVGESISSPEKYYRNNVSNTLNLLRVMLNYDVRKLVFSSTCATYGLPNEIPITESHPQFPISPYGKSKLMVEQILEDYATAYGLSFVSLRYFNAAGASVNAEIGEWHEPETHLIPLALRATHAPDEPLLLFGTDYSTNDGTCIRDYIHVDDLASAHVLALNYLLDGGGSQSFNLGNGQAFSVREIVDTVGKIVGEPVLVREGPRRPGDPPVLIGSSEKIREVLGWQPKTSDIDQIISSAWTWYRKLKQL